MLQLCIPAHQLLTTVAERWREESGLSLLATKHLLIRQHFERKLNGHTDDCLGVTQQLRKLGCYLVSRCAFSASEAYANDRRFNSLLPQR